jgi:mitogen-activated protein kinase kinase kinase
MAEDIRGPKQRRRLYIANPDPDDVLEDRDDDSRNITKGYHQDATNIYNGWYPATVYPSRPSLSTPSRYIPPLSTDLSNLTTNNNQSHPGLSPSNTSSPAAEESTPPPSTPGLPAQPIDSLNLEGQQQDPQSTINTERVSADLPSSRGSKFPRNLVTAPQQHAKGPRPVDSHGRRPRPTPTVTTTDIGTPSANTPVSNQSTLSLSLSADKSDVNKLLIVVTADSERYVTVDITGAKKCRFYS